jgi:serine/threonine-protein kinase
MADAAAGSQPPLPAKRALQRCPNCEVRCDVSCFVDGALARCGHCNVRFEVTREKTPPPAPARTPQPPPENDKPFPLLEGFEVLERLGQGGMGEVFRCTRSSDGLAVAVKILTPQMAAVPDYVRRFGREAAAMAQLDHSGIVRLVGRGKTGPHYFIAMELIEGISLRLWAHKNKPAARQLARLLAQVAHALAYAHARAVVHRDLKPDNVLVTADGRTKVLDFGLAGLHAEGAECLTQSHVSMGTANYMAPEQRKDAKRADHRADLYSFGVMTYELLTGELPIGRFPPPSKAVPGLEARWDSVVERCLETEPAARPHSAIELAHALERLAGLNPAMELAPRTRRRAPKSGIWSWLGIGAGLAVILGVTALHIAQDHGTPTHGPAPAARTVMKKAPRR